jgi:protein-disulfide isomerase
MTFRIATLLAALAALAACAAGAERQASARPSAAAEAQPEPTSPEGLLPGVALEGLTEPQRAVLAAWSKEAFCYCGCPHTVSQCLRVHGGCHHAKRMARLGVFLASSDMTKEALAKTVVEYYSGFDAPKRATIDLAGWGPPLGDAKAPVALVEFSDFTCPFCQLFRPALEKWVEDRAGRVRLYYKPFPIESHQNALVAAQAGEWGREQGIFWRMHDLLFASPQASPADLAGLAREMGKDGVDLMSAIESQRYLPRVRASQAEARAAGLRGTPTIYLQGRKLLDLSEFMMEFALQDEEEWQKSGGWGRDQGE